MWELPDGAVAGALPGLVLPRGVVVRVGRVARCQVGWHGAHPTVHAHTQGPHIATSRAPQASPVLPRWRVPPYHMQPPTTARHGPPLSRGRRRFLG